MTLTADKVSVANKLLLPRSGHKVVSDDKYLYIIGGYVESRETSISPIRNEVRGEIWRFHLIYKIWEKCKFDRDIFSLAASHSVTKHGDCIFITGGTGFPFGVNILDQIIVIDLKKMTQNIYSFKPKNNLTENMPIATYGHSLTLVQNNGKPYVLLIGGTTGVTYHKEVYRIDLISLECERLREASEGAPRGRYKHEAFFWRDIVYLLGGTTQGGSMHTFCLDEIHALDVNSFHWRNLSEERQNENGRLFIHLRCPSMCQNDRFIYVSGGCIESEGALSVSRISQLIYQLDLATLSWSKIGRWDEPCFFHDSVFVPSLGSIFMVGGVKFQDPQRRSNEIYRLNPPSGRIARSLKDMVLELVIGRMIDCKARSGNCAFIDQCRSMISDLIGLGLPHSIINKFNIENTIDNISYAA